MKSILNAIIVAALIVGGLYIYGLVRNGQNDRKVKDTIEFAQRAAGEVQSSRR